MKPSTVTLGTLAACAAIVFSVVVVREHSSTKSSRAASTTNVQTTPTAASAAPAAFPFQMPSGTNSPVRLATDAKRGGVWFWASSPSDSRVYFWDATVGNLRSWSVGVNTQQFVGPEYGLAVDPQGNAWLAARDSLLRVNPTTGIVDRWTVPAVPQSASASAHQPPGLGLDVDLRGVAAAPNGAIVLARAGSSTVQVFDPASQTFTKQTLPDAGEIQSVAVTSDGTIAAAQNNYGHNARDILQLIAPGGKVTTVSVEAAFVYSSGDSFVAGENTVAKVSPNGDLIARSTRIADMIPTAAAGLADGRVAVPTKTGISVLNVSTGTTSTLAIPPFTCDTRGSGLPPGSSPPSSPGISACPAHALYVAVDGAGNLWFVDNGGRIGEFAAGSY